MTDNTSQVTDAPNGNTPPPSGDKKKCDPLVGLSEAPTLPPPHPCPQPCCCPTAPGGEPNDCLNILIKKQATLVKQADRAKALVDELTAIQGKVTSAQADYTQARFKDLLKIWQDQDKLIVDLVSKLVCGVCCWECLLECRLCPELTEIRNLEDHLNGTPGKLTKEVYSLIDLQFWHQRNVDQEQARVDRIKLVLSAWEKPSDTLGDVLDKNGKLIEDTQAIIATDSAKAVYDVFMTLLPRHWAIRPRNVEIDDKLIESNIEGKFVKICKCDGGTPDDCCGPDVGIVSLRERLLGPLPYIVDPADLLEIICCLTRDRLAPASEKLAAAQADLAITTDEIDQVKKLITDRTAAIETGFKAELGNPIECSKYKKKKDSQPIEQTTPTTAYQGDKNQPDQEAS